MSPALSRFFIIKCHVPWYFAARQAMSRQSTIATNRQNFEMKKPAEAGFP
jgi:hypothetical protein